MYGYTIEGGYCYMGGDNKTVNRNTNGSSCLAYIPIVAFA